MSVTHHEKRDQSALYRMLASLESEEEVRMLLEDLCTFKEIEQMAQRLECAELLMQGKTYAQIAELTDISTATLSRISRCIQYGSGGYSRLLYDRMMQTAKKNESTDQKKEELQ